MKNFYLFLKRACLVALALLSWNGVNAQTPFHVWDGANGFSETNNDYVSYAEATVDGLVWQFVHFNSFNGGWDHVRCGRKKDPSIATVKSPTFVQAVSKLTYNFTQVQNVNACNFYIMNGEEQVAEVPVDIPVVGAFTVEIPEDLIASGHSYDLVIDNAPGANGSTRLNKVEVYEADLGKTNTQVTFAEGAPEEMDPGRFERTITNVATVSVDGTPLEGATVTYESSNEELATVDENGVVTIAANKAGTAVIRAIYAGDDTYNPSEASYTIRVKKTPISTPTIEGALKASMVLQLLENKSLYDFSEKVYVKGYITQIDEISTEHKNATYYIADDLRDSPYLKVYRGKALDNTDITIDNQISVGDYVIIYGQISTQYDNIDPYSEIVSQTYMRDVTPGNFGTLCLPYGGTVTGAQLYTIAGKNDMAVALQPVEDNVAVAGTPYIYKADAETLEVSYAGDCAEAMSVNGLIGSYLEETPVAAGKYLISNNMVSLCGEGCYITPNKAYIDLDAVPAEASSEGLVFLDIEGADGINDVRAAAGQGKQVIYNLQGQRLSRLQKGINIINGTKYFVK